MNRVSNEPDRVSPKEYLEFLPESQPLLFIHFKVSCEHDRELTASLYTSLKLELIMVDNSFYFKVVLFFLWIVNLEYFHEEVTRVSMDRARHSNLGKVVCALP